MVRPESPTREDPVAAAMSEVLGGPVGDHAAGHHWWNAARVLAGVTGVVLAAGMVAKTACVPSAWGNPRQPYSELCWTGLAGRPADAGTPPHVTTWLVRLVEALPGDSIQGFDGEDAKGEFVGFVRDWTD